ncbi:HAD-like domain-containing protein, partial [Blyttiomyces helicus]
MRTDSEETPLQQKLSDLAESIAKLGAAAALLQFCVLLIKYVITTVASREAPSAETVATHLLQILINSITVIVVAVPEGLPLAVTLALAYATTQMLKDRNLVRVLSACETMAGATTICSDKTGTLTENKMTVVAGTVGRTHPFEADDIPTLPTVIPPSAAPLLKSLAQNAAQNSSAFFFETNYVGSTTEVALLHFIEQMKFSVPDLRADPTSKIVQIFPFSSERKLMATVVHLEGGEGRKEVYRVYVKGAAEIVLKLCSGVADLAGDEDGEGAVVALDAREMRHMGDVVVRYAERSLRAIALAHRDLTPAEFTSLLSGPLQTRVATALEEEHLASRRAEEPDVLLVASDSDDENSSHKPHYHPASDAAPARGPAPPTPTAAQVLAHPIAMEELISSNLICDGIVGIEDPLREGVLEAVKSCQRAGIVVRMVTGDNLTTARSIAAKAGILTRGGVIMEGSKFRKLSHEELDAVLPRLQVLARSSPTDKMLLVGELKAAGHTVAVTGDGTNDGPALKLADVGFSMGLCGTEVAKEASSIILMDDDFAGIVKAVLWGRGVNDSVKKFLQFQL